MQQREKTASEITEELFSTIPKVFYTYIAQREYELKTSDNLAYKPL